MVSTVGVWDGCTRRIYSFSLACLPSCRDLRHGTDDEALLVPAKLNNYRQHLSGSRQGHMHHHFSREILDRSDAP